MNTKRTITCKYLPYAFSQDFSFSLWWTLLLTHIRLFSCFDPSTCYRPCTSRLDCGSAASFPLLQYKLLTLPLGIPAHHNVARLSAFSESGVLQDHTTFTILEQGGENGERPFGIKDEAGRGIIFTVKPLEWPGLVRLRVQATTLSDQGRITYQSIFIIYISISKYPYWVCEIAYSVPDVLLLYGT